MAEKTDYDKQMDHVRDVLKEEHDRQRREAKRQQQSEKRRATKSQPAQKSGKKGQSLWQILFG